ncbi:undecaprenyl-diphosphatase [Candidatus Pacearchaeota archaeon]|nr:undecaprenyl-diphosphatase [Candidatus Pacearchaeota archaeon]|tara:strand:- start:4211 stop:4993 length:783 start_codon:yes stop_codon:yes gene_type:complete
MNELISALLIAVVQGLTEWLPVSSSGHLVVVERLLGFEGGLFFDVALHFGTLMAVFVYFGREITDIIEDILKGKWKSENARLGFLILLGTVPAAIVGLLFTKVFEVAFESLTIAALGFGITGVFLFIAGMDFSRSGRGKRKFGWKESLGVGIAQVFALFPGISRSGMTLGSGMIFGLDEKQAIRFSFLMSIPVILGANILTIGNRALPAEMIWATLVAFIVGLLAIHLMYKYLLTNRKNLRWFGAYALILGIVIGVTLIL